MEKLSKKQRTKLAAKKAASKKTAKKKVVKKKSSKKSVKSTSSEPKSFKNAVSAGKKAIKDGDTKANAARIIFKLMKSCERKWIIKAFMEGAGLTKAGASTYHFNISNEE